MSFCTLVESGKEKISIHKIIKCVNLHVNVSNNLLFSVSYLYIYRSINLPAVEKAVGKSDWSEANKIK